MQVKIPENLKPNTKQYVQNILNTQKISNYKGQQVDFKGKAETIDRLKAEMIDWKSYKLNHPEIKISIKDLGRLKQMFQIVIVGRENTMYQYKNINAFMFFPDEYPEQPPTVLFETVTVDGKEETFQHVNIFSSGLLCQAVIKGDFTSTLKLKDLLRVIESTIYQPNPDSAANGKMGSLYEKPDKTDYDNQIRRQSSCLEWEEDQDEE